MNGLTALQLLALAALGFAVIASVIASATVPTSLKVAAPWSPQAKYRLLLLHALLPAILALAGVVATLLPSLLALLWPSFDHCMVHPGEHLHLCLAHLPEPVGNLGSRLCLLGAGVFIVLHAARGIAMLYNAVLLSSRLVARAHPMPHLGARVVMSTQPLCLLVGVLRPTVLISQGLLQELTAEQLDAVLLHERAHARRHDTLLRLVARATTLLLWRPTRRRLLFELELAAEQCCDEAAACAIGDRLAMADTIIKVERLLQHPPPALSALAVSFGGTTVPQRVTSLLEPQRPESRKVPLLAVLFLALALLFTSSAPIHHATETLLAVLTR